MQTIGLLGGMSWVSTQLYYRHINKAVAEMLGGTHSAKLLLYSFDFAEIEALQERGDWSGAAHQLGERARALYEAGADFIVLCTNTMHLVADEIQRIGGAPLLHIGDATADALTDAGVRRVVLLGTRYTMEQPFLRERLERHGIDVMVPNEDERAVVHRVIYDELIKDVVTPASRERFLEFIARLVRGGAQGVVSACTEIELLVTPQSISVPLFETAAIHARAAARRACGAPPANV